MPAPGALAGSGPNARVICPPGWPRKLIQTANECSADTTFLYSLNRRSWQRAASSTMPRTRVALDISQSAELCGTVCADAPPPLPGALQVLQCSCDYNHNDGQSLRIRHCNFLIANGDGRQMGHTLCPQCWPLEIDIYQLHSATILRTIHQRRSFCMHVSTAKLPAAGQADRGGTRMFFGGLRGGAQECRIPWPVGSILCFLWAPAHWRLSHLALSLCGYSSLWHVHHSPVHVDTL